MDVDETSQVLENTSDKDKTQQLIEENENLTSENKTLNNKLEVSRFGIQRFSTDDAKIKFYTGFPSYLAFVTFFTWIQPSASSMKSVYYRASESVSLAGRKRNMLLIDELFMFLTRLRLGLFEEDLADRFDCSVQTVSRKVITWVNYLYFVFSNTVVFLEYFYSCSM